MAPSTPSSQVVDDPGCAFGPVPRAARRGFWSVDRVALVCGAIGDTLTGRTEGAV